MSLADIVAVLKNLTNVVIEKLGKLVHTTFFGGYFINYKIIIVQVRYITIETKEATRIEYNRLLFPHQYYGEGLGVKHQGLHLSINAEKETCYIKFRQLFCFNSTVSNT